jgi:hypothetical protein
MSPEIALQAPEKLDLLLLEQLSDRWRAEADRVLRGIEAVKRREENRVGVSGICATTRSSNLCPNAALYRKNQCVFDSVAIFQHRASGIEEWACRHCGTTVSRASMPLSSGTSSKDQVYITPVGFFKSHSAGKGEGTWSCIWERRSEKCSQSFIRKRDLLLHMQEIHVQSQGKKAMFIVDLPADERELNAAKCGYGVSLSGKEMRMLGGTFIVM